MSLKPSGAVRRLWDRLLSGAPQPDPLYVSNRTWKQKARFWLFLATPLAIVMGIVLYALIAPAPVVEKPLSDLPPSEIAARTEIVPRDFKVTQNTDLEVVEVSVNRKASPHQIKGILKNTTGRRFRSAELIFDLTDDGGSQLGGVSTRIEDLAPHTSIPFSFPIPQRNAAEVLVREINVNR